MKSILNITSNTYQQKNSWLTKPRLIIAGLLLAIALHSCTTATVNKYQATALTKYTWQVEYYLDDKKSRFEEFASTSVLNVNGEKPEKAFGDVDDKGLWWPPIPPKPSLDEIEKRANSPEKHKSPEILRTVKYKLSYQKDGEKITLPTNYSVYRQAVKAKESGQSLQLTLGVNDGSVEKAEPQ